MSAGKVLVVADAVIPVLRCADVDEAVAWYRAVEFEEEWRHQFEPGLPRFVAIRRGSIALFLSEHEGDAPPSSLVWLRLEGFDELPVTELGGELLDQPWGPKLRLEDPDGNRLRIGPADAGS